MARFTRRRLLAGAAPLVRALVLAKLALARDAEAPAPRKLQGPIPTRADLGHAAMLGGPAPAVGGPDDLNELLYPPPALPHEPGRLREYTLRASDKEIEIAPGVFFPAWTHNGTVPGPSIRATEDDRPRVNFANPGSHPHAIHFHGSPPPHMRGVLE